MLRYISFSVLLIALCFPSATAADSFVNLSMDELERGIDDGVDRVEEFRFIRKNAEELGVRVFLFGGSAATFAHYVKWSLRERKGDTRYMRSLFNWNFANIFRSGQDVDLAAEGPDDQVNELERRIQDMYRYFAGDRPTWEMRSLRRMRGTKEPLLGDTPVQRQNTDSQSTGSIEITVPPPTERRTRDILHWDASSCPFLEDVRADRISYHRRPSHRETPRFLNGMNPEIFSVVRFVAKALQFELKVQPEDWRKIHSVVSAFDGRRDITTSYAQNWLRNNVIKAIRHSADLEYAKEVFRITGLEQAISDWDPTAKFWLNREPLRSKPPGEGDKATAASIGLTEVSHDTTDYVIWEAIQRSPRGRPNIFISREGAPGERAAHGDGFYTLAGRVGAWQSGFTVRFRVLPHARLGSDFLYVGGGMYLFLNREALEVIPEAFDVGPLELFRALPRLKREDGALFQKLRRASIGRIRTLGTEERADVLLRMTESLTAKEPPVFVSSAIALLGELSLTAGEMFSVVNKPSVSTSTLTLLDQFLKHAPMATLVEFGARIPSMTSEAARQSALAMMRAHARFIDWDPALEQLGENVRLALRPAEATPLLHDWVKRFPVPEARRADWTYRIPLRDRLVSLRRMMTSLLSPLRMLLVTEVAIGCSCAGCCIGLPLGIEWNGARTAEKRREADQARWRSQWDSAFFKTLSSEDQALFLKMCGPPSDKNSEFAHSGGFSTFLRQRKAARSEEEQNALLEVTLAFRRPGGSNSDVENIYRNIRDLEPAQAALVMRQAARMHVFLGPSKLEHKSMMEYFWAPLWHYVKTDIQGFVRHADVFDRLSTQPNADMKQPAFMHAAAVAFAQGKFQREQLDDYLKALDVAMEEPKLAALYQTPVQFAKTFSSETDARAALAPVQFAMRHLNLEPEAAIDWVKHRRQIKDTVVPADHQQTRYASAFQYASETLTLPLADADAFARLTASRVDALVFLSRHHFIFDSLKKIKRTNGAAKSFADKIADDPNWAQRLHTELESCGRLMLAPAPREVDIPPKENPEK